MITSFKEAERNWKSSKEKFVRDGVKFAAVSIHRGKRKSIQKLV